MGVSTFRRCLIYLSHAAFVLPGGDQRNHTALTAAASLILAQPRLDPDDDRPECVRSLQKILTRFSINPSARYTENPFGSSHSLDANPFDDPTPDPAHAARMEELAQRERDLERRETELAQKADHIKKHGRNNFPPCEYPPPESAQVHL